MTDIHAALGISQMKRLDGYIKEENLAYRYKELLMNFPIKFQQMNIDESALHLYRLFCLVTDPKYIKKCIKIKLV